jgi:hypothetical protein
MPKIRILGQCGNRHQNFAPPSCHFCNKNVLTHPLFLLIPHTPPTVFEVIAVLLNSSKFNRAAWPSDCHFNFQEATPCTFDLVAGLTPATLQKIEDSLASMSSDLFRIITSWEQSGQGEGGRDEEEIPHAGDSVGGEEDDVESFAGTSLANNTVTNHNKDKLPCHCCPHQQALDVSAKDLLERSKTEHHS